MPDWNCCWPGGSWHTKCTDSGPYTWHDGWHLCKEQNDAERRRAHGDAQGHFGRGMSRVCPHASAKVVDGPTGSGISVVYVVYGASGGETSSIDFFGKHGLDEMTKIDGGTSVQVLRPQHHRLSRVRRTGLLYGTASCAQASSAPRLSARCSEGAPDPNLQKVGRAPDKPA